MMATPIRCPLREACNGGANPGDESCAEGYTGPLCGVCGPDYYRGLSSCEKCGHVGSALGRTLGVLTALVAVGGLVVYLGLRASLGRMQGKGRGETIKRLVAAARAWLSRQRVSPSWPRRTAAQLVERATLRKQTARTLLKIGLGHLQVC